MVPRVARMEDWKGNDKSEDFLSLPQALPSAPDSLPLEAGTVGTQGVGTEAEAFAIFKLRGFGGVSSPLSASVLIARGWCEEQRS